MPASHFNFYEPNKTTTSHKRHLPHLEQKNICYLITMMTADAFPKAAQKKLAIRKKYGVGIMGSHPLRLVKRFTINAVRFRRRISFG